MNHYIAFPTAALSPCHQQEQEKASPIKAQIPVRPVILLAGFQEASGHQASLLRSRTKSLSPSFLRESPSPALQTNSNLNHTDPVSEKEQQVTGCTSHHMNQCCHPTPWFKPRRNHQALHPLVSRLGGVCMTPLQGALVEETGDAGPSPCSLIKPSNWSPSPLGFSPQCPPCSWGRGQRRHTSHTTQRSIFQNTGEFILYSPLGHLSTW